MKTYLLFASALFAPLVIMGQDSGDIISSAKRMDTINLARNLLTVIPAGDSDEDIARKNPFNPVQPVIHTTDSAKPVDVAVAAAGDRDILLSAIDGITPSGTMQLGDTQFLLFGQKKLKVGDSISIMFQGAAYELQISAVERSSFTLRLNTEEITRPIKSTNKP
jgi:hypothetical protein